MKILPPLRGAAVLAAVLACGLAAACPAGKTLKITVGSQAGGSTDAVGRILAKGLGDRYPQNSVIVENKAGAGGLVPMQAMAGLPPDGCNLLLLGGGSFALMPLKHGDKYALTEFTPVAIATNSFLLLVTAVNQPLDMKGLAALARKDPGAITYGSAGISSGSHLAGENLALATGTQLTHVPYTGDAAQFPDVVSGRLTIGIMGAGAMENVKAGKLKALAITTPESSDLAKGVPSLKELGYDMTYNSMFALVGPKGLPAELAERMNTDVRAVLLTRETRERFANMGLFSPDFNAAQSAAFMKREMGVMQAVVAKARIKLD